SSGCNDHRTGSLVCKNFRKQGVAVNATDNVSAVHTTTQKLANTLQLWNHPASRAAISNQRTSLVRRKSRKFCLRLAGAQINAVHISEHDEFFSLKLYGDFRRNRIGVDVKYSAFRVC